MAKVKNEMTGGKLARHSSFKDRFYFREWRGMIIVSAKPRKRTKPMSERQTVATDKFKQAAVLAKSAAPSQQIEADRLTKGTQYFARDAIYMAMYGTLGYLQLDDGRKLFSVAANQNVSELVDALAQQVGEMLFRNVDGWEPIAIGSPDQVLTFRDGRPQWLDPQGGGGGGASAMRVQRNTPLGYDAGLPSLIPFDALAFSDWEGWNPSEPHFLPLPAGATRFRVNVCVSLPNNTNDRSYLLALEDQDGNRLDTLVGIENFYKPNTAFSNLMVPWQTGWADAEGVEKIAVRVHAPSQSFSSNYQPGTYAVLEVR